MGDAAEKRYRVADPATHLGSLDLNQAMGGSDLYPICMRSNLIRAEMNGLTSHSAPAQQGAARH